jgi:hypothetical protein
MKLRRSLRPGDPLLVGRLRILDGGRGEPPSLGIDVWCPYCKRAHNHGWAGYDGLPEGHRADRVEHRVAHCDAGSPLERSGYWIAVDALWAEENRATYQEYLRRLDAWKVRRAAAPAPAQASTPPPATPQNDFLRGPR